MYYSYLYHKINYGRDYFKTKIKAKTKTTKAQVPLHH